MGCTSSRGERQPRRQRRAHKGGGGKDDRVDELEMRPRTKTSAWKGNWEETKWKEDIKEIWGRSLEDLPTDIDLPRLALKMKISREREGGKKRKTESSEEPSIESGTGKEKGKGEGRDTKREEESEDDDEKGSEEEEEEEKGKEKEAGEEVEEEEEEHEDLLATKNHNNKMELVYEIIATLAQCLGEEKGFQERIKEKYTEYVNEDAMGEESQQLRRFLVEQIGDDSKVGRVLRACHQKMIFPGFYYIKNLIPELPFQDQRGTWVVSVHIGSWFVDVRHRKVQAGKPKNIVVSNLCVYCVCCVLCVVCCVLFVLCIVEREKEKEILTSLSDSNRETNLSFLLSGSCWFDFLRI